MAYLGHGNVSEFKDLRSAVASVASLSLLLRSAFLAIAAAVAVLALSDGGAVSTAAPAAVAAGKADRLAAPSVAVSQMAVEGGFVNDAATRTTTVARGAATPLGVDSPMASRTR